MNAVLKLVATVTPEDVNEAHRLARSSAESAVQYAIRCGELLLAKKAELEHGEFMPWVETNCEFSTRHARRYMEAASKPDTRVRFESLRELLSDGKHSEPQHQREPETLPTKMPIERAPRSKKGAAVATTDGADAPACDLAPGLDSVIILGSHPCGMIAFMNDCNNALLLLRKRGWPPEAAPLLATYDEVMAELERAGSAYVKIAEKIIAAAKGLAP
jgi:hypothetical protein